MSARRGMRAAHARAMRNSKKLLVALVGLLTSVLVGCAADPIDDAADPAPKPADTEQQAEENVGQSESKLIWTRPKCADIWWVCGKCICDACGVVDCRNANTGMLAQ